ncbi:hypothetical protein [Micromonospora phaseoli]|uniref:hypothetical protein n=1 Tax=Micromonospora phaseoli TaxID=1144548 RepID=UPI0018E0A608|nr:hypothetical protein [Micromonospora phaseoli]GIJ81464.1 hypothetical protein Xph01_58960 [Micromonospora phaseoli]
MDVDIAAAALPYLTAAVGAYGGAVLQRVQATTAEVAADSTVAVGRRIIERLTKRPERATDVESAIEDLADDPHDPDASAALRLQLRKLFAADPEFAAEISQVIGVPGAAFTASGERAVSAQEISGVVITGDSAHVYPRS